MAVALTRVAGQEVLVSAGVDVRVSVPVPHSACGAGMTERIRPRFQAVPSAMALVMSGSLVRTQ